VIFAALACPFKMNSNLAYKLIELENEMCFAPRYVKTIYWQCISFRWRKSKRWLSTPVNLKRLQQHVH